MSKHFCRPQVFVVLWLSFSVGIKFHRWTPLSLNSYIQLVDYFLQESTSCNYHAIRHVHIPVSYIRLWEMKRKFKRHLDVTEIFCISEYKKFSSPSSWIVRCDPVIWHSLPYCVHINVKACLSVSCSVLFINFSILPLLTSFLVHSIVLSTF